MKVLFVVDWRNDELGADEQDENIIVWNCRDDKSNRNSFLYRYFWYVKGVLYVMINYNKYDYIVVWQQMIGYLLAFICSKKITNKVIVSSVLYSPENTSGNYLKSFLLSNALKKCKALIYYSSRLAENCKKEHPKYSYKVFWTLMPQLKKKQKERLDDDFNIDIDPYTVFVGGQSDRDFNVVLEAFTGSNIPVVMICPDYEVLNQDLVTDNIRILKFSEVSPEAYYWILNKCYCVIVPLKNLNSSCGQLLFSYGMKYQKPIIATDSYGVRDYIDHMETGILVEVGDFKGVYDGYQLLRMNEKLLKNIVLNARKKASEMSFSGYLKKVYSVIESS